MNINVNKTSERLLLIFISIMPFIYMFQVILQRADIVVGLYIILVLSFILYILYDCLKGGNASPSYYSWFDISVIFYALMMLTWSIFETFYYGFALGFRKFCILFLPIPLYFVIYRRSDSRTIRKIINIISFTATLISLELLIEIVSTQIMHVPFIFQIINFDYVQSISGEELNQLKGVIYRSPGLLEHLHATAFFIAIGFFACFIRYLLKKSKTLLLMLTFNFCVLILSGGRLALLGTLLVIAYLLFDLLRYREYKRKVFRLGISLAFLSLVAILTMLFFFNEAIVEFVQKYYAPVVTSGSLVEDKSFWYDIVPGAISGLLNAVSQYPITLLFGFGPTTLLEDLGGVSDDFFIVQILGQYGIIGGCIFYSFFFVSIGGVFVKSRLLTGADKLYLQFAGAVLALLLISTSHSGVINRKAIYYLLFIAMGIVRKYPIASQKK